MNSEDKKKGALVVLFGIWAGVFAYQFYHQPVQRHQPLKFKSGEVASRNAPVPVSDSSIRLDLLKSSSRPLVISKNIFEPIHIYVPPPPKVEPPPPPPPVVVPPPPTPEEIARQQALQELSQYSYLGYLNKGNNKVQGFFSRSGELFTAGKGEIIAGTIMLKEIDPNQAIIRDKNTGTESTLNLATQ